MPIKRPLNNPVASIMVHHDSGWLRIYCGPFRNIDSTFLCFDEASRIIHIISTDTTELVVRDLDLPMEYTLWVQIGGAKPYRLKNSDCPYIIQKVFLKRLGYESESRRTRLSIDPDLKYLMRFFIGPAEIPMLQGVSKAGLVDILNGLVFPQWRRRYIAIVGHQLLIFPGKTSLPPDKYDLYYCNIMENIPKYNRLILKISMPSRPVDCMLNNTPSYNSIYNSCEQNICIAQNSMIGSSSLSISCASWGEHDKVLYLGFEESWERDLWFEWLLEASEITLNEKSLDLTGAVLYSLPQQVLQSCSDVNELSAGKNKLQEIGLSTLTTFNYLKILRLPCNDLTAIPEALLNLTNLTVLDLADNQIEMIPDKISNLKNLVELSIDRNVLTSIPNTIKDLLKLAILQASQNYINCIPPFMVEVTMKTITSNNDYITNQRPSIYAFTEENFNKPITKISLRGNHLKGNLLLGNYGNLTQLDISENSLEFLNLTALNHLESLQCSRNMIKKIMLNGLKLTSLIAGNNALTEIIIEPVPVNLRHLDISFNKLESIPEWLLICKELRTIFACNNYLTQLPVDLFCSDLPLHTIQLEHNQLTKLPAMPLRAIPLQAFFAQGNKLEELPENFFTACCNLTILNVSCNKLTQFPVIDICEQTPLERLYATSNFLTNRVLESLVNVNHLKILHIGYNCLTVFPESCANNWPELEELILSGNKLQHLPGSIANLQNLKILRVHSNQLQTVPSFVRTTSLRVLDLAHNQLDKVNFVSLVSKKLRFLDLSCNEQLQIDPRQFNLCCSERRMSLVDVSGRNRAALPTTKSELYQENYDLEPPWQIGFSETAGVLAKLYISQLRLPNFCNNEALFGIFDGESNRIVPDLILKILPKLLLDERTIKETATDYMKYTLLSAHRELTKQGQRQGVCATLCHISFVQNKNSNTAPAKSQYDQKRKFVLKIASVGEASALLIRQTGHVQLTIPNSSKQLGNSSNYPLIVPDPETSEITLGDQDEYVVVANKKVWKVMDADTISQHIRRESNVILAAKRILDIAQSYGADENISVIVVKFKNLLSANDYLMRELRYTMKKKSPPNNSQNSKNTTCCCDTNNNCFHSAGPLQFIRHPSGRSDRSSPSGQSDHTISDKVHKSNHYETNTICRRPNNGYATNERRSLRGGVVRAVRAKIEEESDRDRDGSDSAVSEEQFKCWEYMLEQNTQLLFDKELNTVSKAYTKNINTGTNLNRPQMKELSSSTPQLIFNGKSENKVCDSHQSVLGHQHRPHNTSAPFLSADRFGSVRTSSNNGLSTASIFKSLRGNTNYNRIHPISGGPNAAYFGSLQRLMPYNLEYDFAAIQERIPDGSIDSDNRMQQYWGVATTEL